MKTEIQLPLQRTYQNHLQDVVLPFWLRAVDSIYGGVYTCFDNTGEQLISTDKYTWSQGRFAWLMARLSRLAQQGIVMGDPAYYLHIARQTANFLRRHAFLPNGACAYLLNEAGKPIEAIPGQGHDISIFADCFVIIGLAETARVTGDEELLELALRSFWQVVRRFESGDFQSEPYPIPSGYRAHSFPMILLNTSQELASALTIAQHRQAAKVRAQSEQFLQDIITNFILADGLVIELLTDADQDTLLARHYNPGHALESMWFVITEAQRLAEPDVIELAVKVVKRAFALGWDTCCGGLLRFVDNRGGEPRGHLVGGSLEQLIRETWDTKLWWPHAEALYTTLLAYCLTRDPVMLDHYVKTHRYTFTTFPNPNRTVGEWIQIRNRQGNPLNRFVALPVKDPFHVLRSLMLVLTLLHNNAASFAQDPVFSRETANLS